MESYEDIKKMLEIEQREQKRTARGIHGRATKVGKFTKDMLTPVNLVHGWDKRRYKGMSRVTTYNMWENEIIPYEEFLKKPVESQAALLAVYNEKFKRKDLTEAWGIKYHKLYYDWLEPFGLVKKMSKNESSYKESETANTNLVPDTKNEEQAAEIAYAAQDAQATVETYKELSEATSQAPVSPVEDDSKTVDTSTFTFHYQETVAGRTAAKKLEKLALFLEDEDTKYEVLLQVREKGE